MEITQQLPFFGQITVLFEDLLFILDDETDHNGG